MIDEQQSQLYSETNYPVCRVRILLMEDDLGIGILLQKKMERMACTVEVARDGQEGLTMFANNTYDVVIADYIMPIVNGLEVLEKLKNLIPVIILTGQGDEMVAVDALQRGAADYMIKDIDGKYLDNLPAAIDRVLERQQLVKERRQALAELQAREASYRAIIEEQTEMICRCEPGGKLTFANEAFCSYFGIQQSDIIFQSLATVLSRKVYQSIKKVFKTLTPQNSSAMNTHDIKFLSGKVRWIQWTNRAIFIDNSATAQEYLLVGRDITEYHELKQK